MAWARLDDGFHNHPKVLKLDKDLSALTLWVLGLSYCAQQKTDGFLTRAAAVRLVGLDHVDNWAAALVRVRLWRIARGGYRYHDYTDYNWDRNKIDKRVAHNRARQKRFRNRNASPNALGNALVTPLVTGSHPVPSHPKEKNLAARNPMIVDNSAVTDRSTAGRVAHATGPDSSRRPTNSHRDALFLNAYRKELAP